MTTKIEDYSEFVSQQLTQIRPRLKKLKTEKVSRNRLRVSFTSEGRTISFRLLMFAVGGSGRGNDDERRIEITSTYEGGLTPDAPYADVVMGVERDRHLVVGIDARRLQFGGPTSNASTFVYPAGFDALAASQHMVLMNPSKIIPNERQVYMTPIYLPTYLSNVAALHEFGVLAAGASIPKALTEQGVSPDQPEAVTAKFALSFAEQVQLAMLKMEVGQAGEQKVFARERKRIAAGAHSTLAEKVRWISQTHPFVGYDIESFSESGELIFVEVKSSTSALKHFHFSYNEYKVAKKYGSRYKIVCVSHTFDRASFLEIDDPVSRLSNGSLTSRPDGYLVSL